jgi:hypothetical protein
MNTIICVILVLVLGVSIFIGYGIACLWSIVTDCLTLKEDENMDDEKM